MPGIVSSTRLILRFVLLVAVLCLPGKSLSAVSCSMAMHLPPSEADQALLGADYAKAAALYQAGLASHPGNAVLTMGLVHALLHQQKVQEAADAVKAALAVAPTSAVLITLRGEVELRQGMPWLAFQTALESDNVDVCNARNHLLLARLWRLNSMYASSRKQLEIAHGLDPEDPEYSRRVDRHTSVEAADRRDGGLPVVSYGKGRGRYASLEAISGEPEEDGGRASQSLPSGLPGNRR